MEPDDPASPPRSPHPAVRADARPVLSRKKARLGDQADTDDRGPQQLRRQAPADSRPDLAAHDRARGD